MPMLNGRDLHKTYVGKMEATRDETDHSLYVWELGGRTCLSTELSTPFEDMSSGLVSHIARRQLLLPGGAADLARLVRCTMSREQWRVHVLAVADSGTRRIL
jgi:hypothetical protein